MSHDEVSSEASDYQMQPGAMYNNAFQHAKYIKGIFKVQSKRPGIETFKASIFNLDTNIDKSKGESDLI